MKFPLLFFYCAALLISSFSMSKVTGNNDYTTVNSLDVKTMLAQKLMLDMRYFCPQKPALRCLTPLTELPDSWFNFIKQSQIGGVILFSENINSINQTVELTQRMQLAALTSANGKGLFIAVDQEGGRVARLPRTWSTPFLSAMALGGVDNELQQQLAQQVAEAIAKEVSALGINLNFSPVVDVNNNPNNPVINIRSYSQWPDVVSKLASAQLTGYKQQGIIASVKHFPGHGDTHIDSHVGLPVVDKSLAQLNDLELAPFVQLINNNQVDVLMTAHIQFPQLDSSVIVNKANESMIKPATLSHAILTGLLRDQINYQGVVITDALDMAGISHYYDETQAVKAAFTAGADIALMPIAIRSEQDFVKVDNMLEQLTSWVLADESRLQQLITSYARVDKLKQQYQVNEKARLRLAANTLNIPQLTKLQSQAKSIVNNSHHQALYQTLAEAALTKVKGSTEKLSSNDSALLLMPDKNKCEALVESLRIYKVTQVQCLSLLSDSAKEMFEQLPAVNHLIVGNIEPAQSILEIGPLEDRNSRKTWRSYKAQQQLVTKLLVKANEGSQYVSYLSLRSPFDITSRWHQADTIYAAYGYNTHTDTISHKQTAVVYQTIAKALTGHLSVNGQLPVQLAVEK